LKKWSRERARMRKIKLKKWSREREKIEKREREKKERERKRQVEWDVGHFTL
jgi:hypothetical protein